MTDRSTRLTRLLFPLLTALLCFAGGKARATHLYGADFYYTHVSGNTYTVSLAVYGDCAGQIFYTLANATPEVEIYNNGSLWGGMTLFLTGPGVEVTPVCPEDANNTACWNTASSIPGVKRYIYSNTVTLSGASAGWLFRFTGNMMVDNTLAGRSTSITNIVDPPVMVLEATLNNMNGGNSSPTLSTIPTPFFCINKPASYNPGALDANSTDVLSFALVAGLQPDPPYVVQYQSGYSASNPLAVSAGTFSFNSTNGQLDFTPNLVQRSLVVNKVTETRNGTVVGTCMREMTFVVLNNCANNPPGGNVSGPSAGTTVINTTTIRVCNNQGPFSFNINPTDADGNNITMSWAGIPVGATFAVSSNGTANPQGTFSWNTASATASSYTFYITYTDNGCPLVSKQTVAYTLLLVPAPTLSYTQNTNATCSKKAKFTMTVSGGTAPFTYTVSQGGSVVHSISGATSSQQDSLLPGSYVLSITDAGGCTDDQTITIVAPPEPNANITKTTPSCTGYTNGQIVVSGTGTIAPYKYAIGTGAYQTSGTFTGLAAGTYTIYIKDANDCVRDTLITITDPAPIKAFVYRKRNTCNATTDGKITVVGYNSVAPYTYAIGTGSYGSNNVFQNLAAGSYTLHIKNANGCIKDTVVTLADSLVVTAALVVSNISCNGAGDGEITVNGGGAVSPYTYALGTGGFGAANNFDNLTPGNYAVHVKDALGCWKDTVAAITQPLVLNASFTKNNVSCNGGANGSITINATGGTAPYQYQKNAGPFVSSNVFSALAAGTYTMTVKDANGCLKTVSVTITQPLPLLISSLVVNNPTCYGQPNGSIVVAGAGGTTPYTYALGGGMFLSSGTFNAVGAGTIVVKIKDANGCEEDTTITLTQPPVIVPQASVVKSVCADLDNGKVTIAATGGTPGYTYAMGSGAYGSTGVFQPLASGSYVFHTKDANGCIKDTTLFVQDSLTITQGAMVTNVSCYGLSDGAFTLVPGGGIAPYTFSSNSGTFVTSATFSGLTAGSYAIVVKDVNGCTATGTVTVTQPPVIVPNVSVTIPLCYGQMNGLLNLSATGGTPGFQYALNSGAYQSSGAFGGLGAAVYVLHVQDANGCTHDTTVAMTQPSSLSVTAVSGTAVLCHGGNTGTATLGISGGTPPYQYRADSGPWQSSATLTSLTAGYHNLTAQDANGCALDTGITLTEPPPLAFTGAALVMPTCEGFTDGAVTLTAAGGVPAYEFSKDGLAYAIAASFGSLPEGIHTFFVRDNNGCLHDTTVTLVGYPHILFETVTVTGVSCFGRADGALRVEGAGGVQPLSYQMLPAGVPANSAAYDSLATGMYTIRITDSKGCVKDSAILVPTPEVLLVELIARPNDCYGLNKEGGLEARPTGGTRPYTYAWSTPLGKPTDSLTTGLDNDSYAVTVTDVNNCAATDSAEVRYDNCCTPYVPNAFTPNGDGKNDRFRVVLKGDAALEDFYVYNRFGQVVFWTNAIGQGWDGTFNSLPADVGTYYWRVRMTCGN